MIVKIDSIKGQGKDDFGWGRPEPEWLHRERLQVNEDSLEEVRRSRRLHWSSTKGHNSIGEDTQEQGLNWRQRLTRNDTVRICYFHTAKWLISMMYREDLEKEKKATKKLKNDKED